jgi:hypothetical protein
VLACVQRRLGYRVVKRRLDKLAQTHSRGVCHAPPSTLSLSTLLQTVPRAPKPSCWVSTASAIRTISKVRGGELRRHGLILARERRCIFRRGDACGRRRQSRADHTVPGEDVGALRNADPVPRVPRAANRCIRRAC